MEMMDGIMNVRTVRKLVVGLNVQYAAKMEWHQAGIHVKIVGILIVMIVKEIFVVYVNGARKHIA